MKGNHHSHTESDSFHIFLFTDIMLELKVQFSTEWFN